MSNYSQIKNQYVKNTNDEDFFEGMSNVCCELFKRALSEALDSKIRKIEEKIKGMVIQRQANGKNTNEPPVS